MGYFSSAQRQQTQFINFWLSSTCTGDAFASATNDANFTLPLPDLTYVYSRVNGLWEIKFCKNVGPCDTIYTEYGANDVCLPRIVGIGNTRLHVKRFGDADQIEKRITFFDQPYFGGLSFFVDKVGANFTLPSPIRSYFFTGVNTWEHKTAKDAPDGNCVRYAPSVGEKGYGFTLEASVHHVVGAVKYGCTGETVPTTRTTVTPTSTTSSGTMSRFDYWFSTNLIFALVYRFRLR